MRLRVGTVLTLLLTLMLCGCSGAPDRREDARRLQDAITAMPGVSSADVNYENNFERGASIDISVTMPTANHQQFIDVVNRINTVRGDLFDGYYQTASFRPNDAAAQFFEVRCSSQLDATTIADEAIALRLLTTRIEAKSADWFCNPQDRRLTIRENSAAISEVLEAIHTAGADTSSTSLNIQAAATSDMAPLQIVGIKYPFRGEDWRRLQTLTANLDGTPWVVGVGPGSAVNSLSMRVHNPGTAYQQLTAAIATIGAGKDRPLRLFWVLDNPPPRRDGALIFQGSVTVGGCNYGTPPSDGELHPEKYLTPEALDLQRRLRTQYDTCPR